MILECKNASVDLNMVIIKLVQSQFAYPAAISVYGYLQNNILIPSTELITHR